MSRVLLILALAALTACGALGSDTDVSGWPDVDLGAEIEIYKSTDERDLHLHIFRPADDAAAIDGGIRPTDGILPGAGP